MSRPLLLITWRDHYTTSEEWMDPKDLQKQEPVLNRSVGWLVAEDEQRLTIVQTAGPDSVRDLLVLEKACIEKRRVIR